MTAGQGDRHTSRALRDLECCCSAPPRYSHAEHLAGVCARPLRANGLFVFRHSHFRPPALDVSRLVQYVRMDLLFQSDTKTAPFTPGGFSPKPLRWILPSEERCPRSRRLSPWSVRERAERIAYCWRGRNMRSTGVVWVNYAGSTFT